LRLIGNLHGSVDRSYRDELVRRFELDVHKKNRAYSHGNRQKVVLVAGFAARAELLLLDEPTTGLDPLMEQEFRRCVGEARDRGQTVVLSSHILSEVEATCDRVGMLRAGRLVDVGRLDALRRMAAVRVHAHVSGELPDLSTVPGVSDVAVRPADGPAGGTDLECGVTGDIGPLVNALAGAGVERLTTREPSLEELFISRYGGEVDGTVDRPGPSPS
jgi:ABC-2 type transport system ATP-binding protein